MVIPEGAKRKNVIKRASHSGAMRCASFTVDVDCDVNLAKMGCKEAVSQGCEGRRYASSIQGLIQIVQLLEECGIKGTFFLEAKGAEEMSKAVDLASLLKGHEIGFHGLAHEDLTGEGTGIELSEDEIEENISRGLEMIRGLVDCDPIGFRAPYLHVNETILEIIEEEGFVYDSSVIKDIDAGMIAPFRAGARLMEVPIARGRDQAGKKIVSYLWPLHEGKRKLGDYHHLLNQFKDGLLVVATHSWHPVETYNSKLGEQQIRDGLAELRSLIKESQESGMRFMTIRDYLRGEQDD